MRIPEPQSPVPPASPEWASLDVGGSTAKARSWDLRHSSVAPGPASIGPRLSSGPAPAPARAHGSQRRGRED